VNIKNELSKRRAGRQVANRTFGSIYDPAYKKYQLLQLFLNKKSWR